MKLYHTATSPYARIVRIVILEKGLGDRVEVIAAKTRVAGSDFYKINPSGRVPYLVCDDGRAIEDSPLICAVLDQMSPPPRFDAPPVDSEGGFDARRLEACARSMLDGVAVWARERRRPENEQSPGILAHERERALRMARYWEAEIAHPAMRGDLNLAQITLGVTLALETRLPGFSWRADNTALAIWMDSLAERPSFAATVPPPL